MQQLFVYFALQAVCTYIVLFFPMWYFYTALPLPIRTHTPMWKLLCSCSIVPNHKTILTPTYDQGVGLGTGPPIPCLRNNCCTVKPQLPLERFYGDYMPLLKKRRQYKGYWYFPNHPCCTSSLSLKTELLNPFLREKPGVGSPNVNRSIPGKTGQPKKGLNKPYEKQRGRRCDLAWRKLRAPV